MSGGYAVNLTNRKDSFDRIYRNIQGFDLQGNIDEDAVFQPISAKEAADQFLNDRKLLAVQLLGGKQNPQLPPLTRPKPGSTQAVRKPKNSTSVAEGVAYTSLVLSRCISCNVMVAVSAATKEEAEQHNRALQFYRVLLGDVLLIISPEVSLSLGEVKDNATLFVRTKSPLLPVLSGPNAIDPFLSKIGTIATSIYPMEDDQFAEILVENKHVVMKAFDFLIPAEVLDAVAIVNVGLKKACAHEFPCDRAFPENLLCDVHGSKRPHFDDGKPTLLCTLKIDMKKVDGTERTLYFTSASYTALKLFTTEAARDHMDKTIELGDADMLRVIKKYVKLMKTQKLPLRIVGQRSGSFRPGADDGDAALSIIPDEYVTGLAPPRALRFIWPEVKFESKEERDAFVYNYAPKKTERSVLGPLQVEQPPLRKQRPAASAAAAAQSAPPAGERADDDQRPV